MVQILPKENTWGDIGERLGKGLSEGYQTRADEMAIRNSLEKLGDSAQPRQILDALMNTRTYRPEAKQQALKNYMGVKEFEEAQKKGIAERQRAARQHEIEQFKAQTARLKEERDMKKLEDDERKAKDKELKRIAGNRALLERMPEYKDLPKEELQALAENMPEDVVGGVFKESFKTKDKKSIWEEGLEKKAVDDYTEMTKEYGKLEVAKGTLDQMDKLVKKNAKSWLPNAVKSLYNDADLTELSGLSLTSMAPLIKIWNPAGSLAVRKMELIQKQYQVKPTDPNWVAEAKINTLRQIYGMMSQNTERLMKLYEQHEGRPPPEAVRQFDAMVDQQLAPFVDQPEKGQIIEVGEDLQKYTKTLKGQPIIDKKTGQMVISDGETWRVN